MTKVLDFGVSERLQLYPMYIYDGVR